MIVNWPTYLVKYLAMILISNRMTGEISCYIEYNYPTERYTMNEILDYGCTLFTFWFEISPCISKYFEVLEN